ncbi:MAG: allophanate hydrolase [Actinomycetota bacterium]|nr:allophanate hydrolase [Actinomycetota bacterium]
MTDTGARRASARDAAEVAIERRRSRPELNVWTSLVPDGELRTDAARVDRAVAHGAALPLAGLSFAVKDNIDVARVPTTAGCRAFSYTPERSSPVVAQLREAGALFVGKTNLDQFATGLVGTRSPDFGLCRNPVDPAYIAGGSSAGSAIAVATGMVDLALATDTAGSGRVPAACCGIVGLKPTRGLISTRGVVPASRSFDCVTWLTTSVRDAARLHARSARAGGERLVPTRVRIGVPIDVAWFGEHDAAARFEAAVAQLAAAGAELVPIAIEPFVAAGKLLYGSALATERVAAFGAFAAAHPDAMDPTVLAIVTEAARHRGTDVVDAFEQLAQHRERTRPTWDAVDMLVVPTIVRHPTIEEVLEDPFGPNSQLGTYTNFVNLLDLCAMAVPAGLRADGLPFGVSLVAPAHAEALLFATAAVLTGEPSPPVPRRTRLAVVGAHLSGEPLNHQLLELGARLVTATTTAPEYRLFDLGTTPARPGMVRQLSTGAAIALEVWEFDAESLGTFLPRVPAPLAIGSVELADGSTVLGFLCESYALDGARDITEYGGWRAYRAAARPAP